MLLGGCYLHYAKAYMIYGLPLRRGNRGGGYYLHYAKAFMIYGLPLRGGRGFLFLWHKDIMLRSEEFKGEGVRKRLKMCDVIYEWSLVYFRESKAFPINVPQNKNPEIEYNGDPITANIRHQYSDAVRILDRYQDMSYKIASNSPRNDLAC